MNPIQKIKDSPHYPQLKQSLEYYHCRKRFIVSFVLVCIFTIPTFLLLFLAEGSAGSDGSVVIVFLCALFFIGYSIYCAHRWLQIFLHMDDYLFFPVVLSKPFVHHSRFAAYVCYSLTFPNMDGKIITRETAAMFRNYTDPCLQDYNNKTVLVGYNEETDRLVVIKRVDS